MPPPQPVEVDVDQELAKQKRILANNKKITQELEHRLQTKIDETIDRLIDPASPSYEKGLEHFLEQSRKVYVEIDALHYALNITNTTKDEQIDRKEIDKKMEEYQESIEELYQRQLQKIIANPALQWTGDVQTDFPQLQQALFIGENRFFYNPSYANTVYQKDMSGFSQQIESGIVQCQVARFTTLVLYDIYHAKRIPVQTLENYKVSSWKDHVSSAYQMGETVLQLAELDLTEPMRPDVRSPDTQETGVVLPLQAHLALYLAEYGATDTQKKRLRKLKMIDQTKTRYRLEEIPAHIIDFTQRHGEGKTVYDTKTTTPVNEREWETRKVIEDYIENTSISISEEKGVSVYFMPKWTSNEEFLQYIVENYDKFFSRTQIETVNTLHYTGRDDVLKKIAEAEFQKIVEKIKTMEWFGSDIENLINSIIDYASEKLKELLLQILAKNPELVQEWTTYNPNTVNYKGMTSTLKAILNRDYARMSRYLVESCGVPRTAFGEKHAYIFDQTDKKAPNWNSSDEMETKGKRFMARIKYFKRMEITGLESPRIYFDTKYESTEQLDEESKKIIDEADLSIVHLLYIDLYEPYTGKKFDRELTLKDIGNYEYPTLLSHRNPTVEHMVEKLYRKTVRQEDRIEILRRISFTIRKDRLLAADQVYIHNLPFTDKLRPKYDEEAWLEEFKK